MFCSPQLNICRILKWQFGNISDDDGGIWEARGYACEIVAWRFLTHLSENEAIDYLLHELPKPTGGFQSLEGGDSGSLGPSTAEGYFDEHSPLLRTQIGVSHRPGLHQFERQHQARTPDLTEEDPAASFVGLDALEIAAIANAKKFLSQRVVQKIVDDIWSGNIVFWDTLSVNTNKRAQLYNKGYVKDS